LQAPVDNTQEPSPVAENATAISNWQPVNNSSTSGKTASTKGFTGVVNDLSISQDVLSNGLVLVFAKEGNQGQSLPFVQSGSIYWYYQVEEGQISVSAEGSTDQSKEFQYIVLTSDQLNDLEARGYPKNTLVNISWNDAVDLFKK
jgi:hypothetical protein